MVDLKSNVARKGKIVTQIIHFVGGEKRTFESIKTFEIKQGQFTKLYTMDGRLILVNDKNVLCIEVFNKDNSNG